MKHDMEALKQSLRAVEGLARATSGDYQNLKDAIDELEALRRNETLAANYANRELNAEREISQLKHMVEHLRSAPPIRVHFGDATGENLQRIKAEWLKSLESGTPLREVRFADERTTELTKRIAELEARRQSASIARNANEDEVVILTEKAKSLEAQVVAATNDAARAELRARDLASAMEMQLKRETGEFHIPQKAARAIWDKVLAAAPDSDARLREVMGRVANLVWADFGYGRFRNAKQVVDEVLGVKP